MLWMWNSISRGSPASGDSWKMDTVASMFCHNNWCAIKIAHQQTRPQFQPPYQQLFVVWQSSRPASFSPAGLTLWSNWLERWLATLRGYQPRFEYQWGRRCRDFILGAHSHPWVKPITSIVHSEPTDCHVSLWPGENGGLPDRGVLVPLRKRGMWHSSWPASFSPAGLTLWPNWLKRWLATLSGLSTQVRMPVRL